MARPRVFRALLRAQLQRPLLYQPELQVSILFIAAAAIGPVGLIHSSAYLLRETLTKIPDQLTVDAAKIADLSKSSSELTLVDSA